MDAASATLRSDPVGATGLLRGMLDAAIDAARPARVLPPWLPPAPPGRTIVVGAGKAAASMAAAVEAVWTAPLEGLVITRYGHAVPCARIEVVEAAHPVPDEAGLAATERMLGLAASAGPDDLVLALMSGGGSALLTRPAAGLTLADKQAITHAMLASGATIAEMNCVRRHLSAVKGGRLALAAHPARLVTLVISDVPGDDPAIVASGPTLPDSTTAAMAREILARYRVDLPDAVRLHLARDEGGVRRDDPRLAGQSAHLIATPRLALEAAADVARHHGVTPVILGDSIEGEAREVARVMAGIARQAARHGVPAAAPCALISGGETTVTIGPDTPRAARGGRNVEFLLALALELDAQPGIHALAADSDGIDGTEPVAGAVIGPRTLAASRAAGLDPGAILAAHDAHTLFERIGAQVVTGPTLTNVNDIRVILVTAQEAGE